MPMDGRTGICSSAIAPALPNKLHPCNDSNTCTSTIPGGRISQGAMDGGANMPMGGQLSV